MKYAVFLRGINVGGRVVKMADLKACLESIGLQNVKTILQSGNVVFESDQNTDKLKRTIEEALTKTFNYPAKVQVFTLEQIESIIQNYPFDRNNKDYQHYVIFMESAKEKELEDEATFDKKVEQIKSGSNCIYWTVPKGMTLKSKFSKYLTKPAYKEFNTVRNINTLEKVIR